MFYQRFLKPLFFLMHPDRAHTLMVFAGDLCGRIPPARFALSLIWGYRGPDISKVVDGIRFERPVLLSAGFDTEGRLTSVLGDISFGGEEIGSISTKGCKGNAPPNMTRLVRNKSIVINKGLRNKGVETLIKKLQTTKRVPGYVIGISIAQTDNHTDEEAAQDYVTCFRRLNEAGVGDYYTINISCPNTYSGETFAAPHLLQMLIERMREISCSKPVYFKMPINLPWEKFKVLLDIISASPYQGVIIGNLNKDYAQLDFPEDAPKEFRGGLSGKPCLKPSLDLIRKTRETYGGRFTIIGTGGIFSGEDAVAKFQAGADLVQLITGMVFEGPGLMKRVCRSYSQLIHNDPSGKGMIEQ